MNKKELTERVVKKTGLKCCDAQRVVDAVFQTIRESLENGESNTYHEFGSFKVFHRMERKGVNPSTRKAMVIPSKKVVKFIPSKNLVVK